jgi:hypothetical protein
MLRWHKRYGSGQSSLDTVISLASAETARRAWPIAEQQTYGLFIDKGLPTFKQYVEEVGDWEVAAAMVILTTLEQQFGSDVYQRAAKEYEAIQAQHGKKQPRQQTI